MNVEDATRRVMLFEAARDQFEALAKTVRADLYAAAVAQYAESRSPVTWRPPDLGTWSQVVSKDAPVVLDRVAFVAWCKDRYPTAVVEAIVPAFEKALMGRLSPVGEGVVDPATGEIVPGLGVRHGGESKTIRFLPSGDAQAVADQHAAALVAKVTAELGITDA